MITITKTQFVLVLVVSKPSTNRSYTVNCFASIENGDQLLQFIVKCPSKILTLPCRLEDKYYSASHAAKISDYYFFVLKYVMGSVGVDGIISDEQQPLPSIIRRHTSQRALCNVLTVQNIGRNKYSNCYRIHRESID